MAPAWISAAPQIGKLRMGAKGDVAASVTPAAIAAAQVITWTMAAAPTRVGSSGLLRSPFVVIAQAD
jgi:hypothetical protein